MTADLPEDVRVLAQLHGPSAGLQIGSAVVSRFEPLGDWVVPVFVLT